MDDGLLCFYKTLLPHPFLPLSLPFLFPFLSYAHTAQSALYQIFVTSTYKLSFSTNNITSQFLSQLTHMQALWCHLYLLSSKDLLRNSHENTQILRPQSGSEGYASLLRLARCIFISLSVRALLELLCLSIYFFLKNSLSQKFMTLLLIKVGFQKNWS